MKTAILVLLAALQFVEAPTACRVERVDEAGIAVLTCRDAAGEAIWAILPREGTCYPTGTASPGDLLLQCGDARLDLSATYDGFGDACAIRGPQPGATQCTTRSR